MYYLNLFLIYSILGFICETLITIVTNGSFQSGILCSPWTPIYGIGVVSVLMISNFIFSHFSFPKWIRVGFIFLGTVFLLSFLSWLVGTLFEIFFHTVLWNYRHDFLSFGNYISLPKSVIWSLGSTLFIYFVNPMLEKNVKNIPHIVTFVFMGLFACDFLVTIVQRIMY